jgi:pimeloyl-ACP methyl ester carboxylesterase
MKHKLLQVMKESDDSMPLSGSIQIDDVYWGGEKHGGKRGRGAAGKTPFVAAIQTNEKGHPIAMRMTKLSGFKKAQSLVASGKPKAALSPIDFIYCKDTSASAEAVISYYATDMRKDTPHLLPKIAKPVLVFAGAEDQVVKGLDKMLAAMAEANEIELEVTEGADHSFRDLYAEDLVDRAVEFLSE